MAMVLGPENFHGRFNLTEGGEKVGFGGLAVDAGVPAAQGLTFADAGINDNPVQLAKLLPEPVKYIDHLLVLVNIQRLHADAKLRILLLQLLAQGFQTPGPTGAEGQMVATGRKLPSHAFAQSGTGPGDQNGLAHRHLLVREFKGSEIQCMPRTGLRLITRMP